MIFPPKFKYVENVAMVTVPMAFCRLSPVGQTNGTVHGLREGPTGESDQG